MDDSLLTNCPHCQTLFRIQHEHLNAAEGEVRCGVCYKVFDAHSEGVYYSDGKDSLAEKTFSNKLTKHVSHKQTEALSTRLEDKRTIVQRFPTANTSPKSSPGLLKAHAQIKSDASQPDNRPPPSQSDIARLHIGNSSFSDTPPPATIDSKRPVLKWTGLSLLAISGLLVQWFWYNLETNTHQPQWHSLYVSACKTLGCESQPYQNIAAIRTDRLEIKTHPDYSNALVIDMIISNSAQHSQPMPVLNVTFYTITGQPLVQRLFKPVEYLGKHLKHLSLIPSKTPVHLSFAILDPGNKAVNYSVSFTPSS